MASLKDIAREAGVSVATVSTVLSGKGRSVGLHEGTCEKVRRVAESLRYRPNLTARGLRTKRGYAIGLLFYNPRELLYAEILAEIHALLLPHGYAGICAFWNTMEEAKVAFNAVIGRGVDGLITSHDDLSLIPKGVPTVLLVQRHPDYDCVCGDRDQSMRDAVRYLLRLGHRRIGTLNLHRPWYEPVINAVLAEHGVRTPVVWTSPVGFDYRGSSVKGMTEILAYPPQKRPTALICRNDTVAMIAMSEAGRHGLRVPDDLSVIGFDGVTLGSISNPPLTSFGVPPIELAKHLVDLMVRRLHDPVAPRVEMLLAQRLMERGSCAPPASRQGEAGSLLDGRVPVSLASPSGVGPKGRTGWAHKSMLR